MSKAHQMEASAALRLRYQDLLESMAAGGRLPHEEAARTTMLNALQRETADFAHAERAVGAAIDAGAPKDGWTLPELRAFIGATKPNTERRNLNCKKCDGSGWEIVEVEVDLGHGLKVPNSAARRCSAGCHPRGIGYTQDVLR